jgi:hypothetical protein
MSRILGQPIVRVYWDLVCTERAKADVCPPNRTSVSTSVRLVREYAIQPEAL